MQHAVGAEAHPIDLLVRLEMQVGRAAADGIQQHLVDEAHYWGIVGIAANRFFLPFRISALDIQPFQIDIGQIIQSACRALEQLLDGITELVVLDQDGLGGQAGTELHIGNGLVVGRVGEANEQLVAATPKRNHPMLAHQLFADQLLRHAFSIQTVQVAIGDTELFRRQFSQRPALHQPVLHEVGHQRQFVALRLLLRLLGAFFIE
ncbi:hypothetical protein D3C78_1123150 [compost metagenome]